tara:strand:+ start:651 stop:992 length:342 start_codon:yes stop_codon:yes gene_type:complete
MGKSKFEIKDTRTFSEKVMSFAKMLLYSVLFWKGRSKGMIYTMNIGFKDVWEVFFPKDFGQKYRYLGTSVWREESRYYKALFPLVLALDYEAKPKWCPRWFLRFCTFSVQITQ